jgi:protein LTV1
MRPHCVQGGLPTLWQQEGGLTPAQLEALDDETAARYKAREAYLRQEAADAAREARRAARRVAAGDNSNGDEDDDDDDMPEMFAPRPKQWDCESVLSMRTTVSQQPSRIGAEGRRPARLRGTPAGGRAATPVRLSAKTGLPLDAPVATACPGHAGVRDDSGSDEAMENLGQARDQKESPEDRKARKTAVKEARRAAREVKKQVKCIYGEERVRAQKHVASSGVASSVTPLR